MKTPVLRIAGPGFYGFRRARAVQEGTYRKRNDFLCCFTTDFYLSSEFVTVTPLEKQPENKTCYYLLLNPDSESMLFLINRKAEAARAGIPEKYTQTSKPHITLVSWEDKPEADEWMIHGITTVLQSHELLNVHLGKASLVGPRWGKHLVIEASTSEPLAKLIADLKTEVPRGRKAKWHLTLAYKVPGDKIPQTLVVDRFDINCELVFDHFTLLKYTSDRKYVELGQFQLNRGSN